jgi:hypothetical protein
VTDFELAHHMPANSASTAFCMVMVQKPWVILKIPRSWSFL